MNRRRFLKYAGATAAVVGGSAVGLDYMATMPASTGNQHSTLSKSLSQTQISTSSTNPATTSSSTSNPEDFVRLQNGKFTYRNQAFTLKGFNYYPRDYGWRIFKAWDKDEVSRELSMASELNCNCIRTFINYQYSTNNVKYERDFRTYYHVDSDYVAHVQEFLDLVADLGYKVILSLFEYVYWDLFEPGFYYVGENYLRELIPQFSDNPGVLAWDIINEPDLKTPFSQPNGVDNISSFLSQMSAAIRNLDKNHLITVGVGKSENLSQIRDLGELTDFISFHDYDVPSKLTSKISNAKEFGKPVVLEEYGKYTYNDPVWPQSENDQAKYYDSVLSIVKETELGGSLFWELMDHPVVYMPQITMGPVYDGKDHIDYHFGIYRIDYSPKPARDIVKEHYA